MRLRWRTGRMRIGSSIVAFTLKCLPASADKGQEPHASSFGCLQRMEAPVRSPTP
jgi:hypothetical protein